MPPRRTGALTFLFTDIVGSTRRWEVDPDGMRSALTVHDAVIRRAIESAGGEVFKHTGDGAAAVFESASAAVEAAIAAQRSLELPVRMGLATGEAQARDGDYFGPAVNRAARITDAAHGGQILLADSSAALIESGGHIDLGFHRLRDVSTPIRLTQVAAEGLRVDFPPVRTLTAVRGNLTATSARLVGRGEQVTELLEIVRRNRIVTLTGTGGVGKTRLSQEIARRSSDEYPDGTWVIELTSISDPGSVAELVADTLNITVLANTTTIDSILQSLVGRTMLILLDNCEHVIDGARELAEVIVRNVDGVTILATSRESLLVPGEQVWPVPPLDVSTGGSSEAVALFIERAQAVNPEFRPEPGSADLAAVSAICSGLDGLALAIELAAARMVSMSPQDLADRLDHRLRLLSGPKAPSVTPHHRTLRDTVAWSYELLDDDERTLLSRCAVFANGFELDAVRAICAGETWDEFAVLDLVDSLVRKSLVTVDLSQERTRYHMLETIRQFAEEQLHASESTDVIRRAHAAFFAARAEEMWVVWNGPEQRTAIDWVDAEFAELRAGFRWAADHDAIELAARIASHTAMLSFVLQRFEAVRWVGEIVDAADAADLVQLPRVHTALCISALLGGHQTAIDHARIAVRLEADPTRDPFEPGWSLFWEAIGHRYLGDIDRWFEICEELSEQPGLARIIGRCGLLGVLAGVGRQEEARQIADDVVNEARVHGNPFWLGWAQASWGRAHASDDPVAALGALRSALEYAREYRLDYIAPIAQREIAALEETRGGLKEALDMFAGVIDRYRSSGNRASAATTLGDIAVMFERLDRPETAATVYGASVPLGFSIAEKLPAVVDRLRAELGDDKFDECVAVGSAMDFADAMAYTQRVLDVAAQQFSSDG